MKKKGVVIYTDGSCRLTEKNKPGGWAFVVEGDSTSRAGGTTGNTNNQMEMTAVYEAMIYTHENGIEDVIIYTDSKYVMDGLNNKWVRKWKNNGWKTSTGQPVKNKVLWEKISDHHSSVPAISIKHVKGHNGNVLNELVDELAKNESLKLSTQKR